MQKLLLALLSFAFVFTNSIHTQALSMSQYFISSEVGPCLTSGGNPKACDVSKPNETFVLSTVESLRTEWMSTSQKVCSEAVISGNFLDGNTIEFTGTNQKISATVTLRDLNLDDINSPNSFGTKATTQGSLTTTTTSTMQDSAPKPLSLTTLPYWTENTGSNTSNSRNGVLFEFFDENENPIAVDGFGAWFGDIETRSNVLPAFMRLYNQDGNNLSENILINEDKNTDLNQCGTTSGTGKSCGNHTTRWIGFNSSDNQTTSVQKFLVVVGEDDLDADGSREHLSFIGTTLAISTNCPTTPIPSPTHTPEPSVTPDPTSTPVISNTPEPTAIPLPTPSLTPTARHHTTPPVTPVTTRIPKLSPVCKRPVKYIVQNRIWKEIQRVKLLEKYKLIHINLKYWK